MKTPRRTFLQFAWAIAVVILVTLCGHVAWSQGSRPIKIVVPYPPGGGADLVARLLGEQIGRAQGQMVLIENRPGASGVIGAEAVSRATPDGSTLSMAFPDLLIASHLRKLNYDPLTSFEPICRLVSTPIIVVVNSSPHIQAG